MNTPSNVELAVGQRWRECDPRAERIVTVIALSEEKQKVQIKGGPRTTWTKLSRFNGRRGGYVFVAQV